MQPATDDQVMSLEEAVWVDADRVSGTPCFRGTRVPVQNLWDYVHGGCTLDEFHEAFPHVGIAQAAAVLRHAETGLAARL